MGMTSHVHNRFTLAYVCVCVLCTDHTLESIAFIANARTLSFSQSRAHDSSTRMKCVYVIESESCIFCLFLFLFAFLVEITSVNECARARSLSSRNESGGCVHAIHMEPLTIKMWFISCNNFGNLLNSHAQRESEWLALDYSIFSCLCRNQFSLGTLPSDD